MRKTLIVAGLVAALAVVGLSQDEAEDLTTLLLSQDQIRQVLEDDTWVLSSIGTLPQDPEGARSATAVYENPEQKLNVILLDFSELDLAGAFIDESIEARRARAASEPEDLAEAINGEREITLDFALLFAFEDGSRQLLVRRGTIVTLFQATSLSEEALIALTRAQLDHLNELGR